MTPRHASSAKTGFQPRWICRIILFTLWHVSISFGASAAAERIFNVPAGVAADTLKIFSEQAGVAVVFATDSAGRVQTNSLRGAHTAERGITLLLQGTGLNAVVSERTGTITVTRDPNASRAVLPEPAALRSAPARSEEPLELSPFVVATERDTGWVAASTLIGSRTNEELLNVPLSVDAITPDFMQDLAAYTLEDASMFVANLVATDELETGTADGRVTYRGIESPDAARFVAQSSRNFFPSFVQTDNYNVERLDFNKGSNSLMFGDASPGGQTTVYTKRARFGNFGQATALYGTYGTYRLQLDVNRKLTEQLAARVNFVERSTRSYVEFADSSLRAAHGTVTYRPLKYTTVRIEAEKGEFTRSRARNFARIRTGSAPGRGFVTNNRWYYTSDGEIVLRNNNTPSATDRVGVSGDSVTFLQGRTATISLLDRVGNANVASGQTLTLPGYHHSINYLGPNDHQDRPYTNFTAWFEQKVGDLYLEAAFNQQNQHQERNQGQFGLVLNIDRDGRPFLDSGLDQRFFGNRAKIGRLSASYPLKLRDWTTQFLVLNAEWQQNLIYSFRRNLANFAAVANTPGSIRNNQITVRAYLDDPAFPTRAFWDRLKPENLPRTATFQPGFYEFTDVNQPFNETVYQRTFSASTAGTYFKDARLRSLFGVRHDTIKRKLLTRIPRDAIDQDIYLGNADAVPDAYSYDPRQDLSNTSLTAGLVYRLWDGFNIYGNFSESFHWQRAVDFTGTTLGPIVGENREIGLKANLLDRRLTLTVAAYEIDRSNAAFEWTPDLLTEVEMEDLFNPNNLSPSDPAYFNVATGLNSEERTVTSKEKARGWEATLQLTRYKGFQARLTFARNKVEIRRDFSKFRALYDAAVARTTAALAPGGNPSLAENAALLADGSEILRSNDGIGVVTGAASAPYSVNWVLDYDIPRLGWLANVRLGVHGTWRDDHNLLFSGRVYRNGSTHPVGAYLIHRRKLFGRDTSFRLGGKNLVDLENSGRDRVWAVAKLDSAGAPEFNFVYVTPPTFDFSITVNF